MPVRLKPTPLQRFLQLEAFGAILLVLAGALALIAANSPLAGLYEAFLQTPVRLQVGAVIDLNKSLLVWTNDLLMALFFLVVGLEIKREAISGYLAERGAVILPGLAALGGMVVPAAIYALLNWNDPVGIRGWAIPSATDIAFALGVLSLFGSRVPTGLKVFLMTLAVLDDLGAVAIIALFYQSDLSSTPLAWAACALALLAVLNVTGVRRAAPYLIVGIILWFFVLKSGIHATLAGVLTAFFVPASGHESPLRRVEQALHPWVAFAIVPLFAFANAGVPLAGLRFTDVLEPIPLGIALGLLLGKPIGVFGCTWLAVRSGLARLPAGVDLRQMFGVSLLCGIGFTMSLFIGMLAFDNVATGEVVVTDRLGILVGTGCAAILGAAFLSWALPRKTRSPAARPAPGR
jgi:Na+:H+ antiporter, NhaA family